jgi:dTDP-4-amino-4,6-dideoxygalactose transaminase
VTIVPFFDLKKQFFPLKEEFFSEIAAACLATKRDELREHSRGCGIGTEIYYSVSLNHQKCLASLEPGWFPQSEAAVREVLALPVLPKLNRW